MATDTNTSLRHGILSDELGEERAHLIEMLTKAYWMEVETVMSYIANSINPEGVRAQEIIESLEEDIQEELGHARQFGERIKELYGVVPGSLDFNAEQSYLQPPDDQIDVVHVIKGVIEAESGAIEYYNQIIEFCEGRDPVTQDMVIGDPPRRGRPPPPVRGLPARVRERGSRLAAEDDLPLPGGGAARHVAGRDGQDHAAARLRRLQRQRARAAPRQRPRDRLQGAPLAARSHEPSR